MREFSKLPNIGKVVEEQLVQVGTKTEDELIVEQKRLGLKFRRLRNQPTLIDC